MSYLVNDQGIDLSNFLVNDPVHGSIKLSSIAKQFIDNPVYQRLRYLKQDGLASFVYPSAVHTRFEHSLGVAHLAKQFLFTLASNKALPQQLSQQQTLYLELAGLCHDLGHGPFSHVFESKVIPRILQKNAYTMPIWQHEDMSLNLFQHIIDNYVTLDNLCYHGVEGDFDVDYVKALITGNYTNRHLEYYPAYTFDIVANQRNNIDVDKVDYIMRDSRVCGINVQTNFQRLMELAKVIDDEICYKWTEYDGVLQIFQDRKNLHQKVFTHRTCIAAELMVTDAVVFANSVLNIQNKLNDCSEYIKLNDNIIEVIKYADSNQNKDLEKAKAILKRMDNRDLYKMVSDVLITVEQYRNNYKTPTEIDIIAHQSSSNIQLIEDDIVVNECKIDLKSKFDNPLDKVNFYENNNDLIKKRIQQYNVSNIRYGDFMDIKVMLYVKDGKNLSKVEAAQEAFNRWHTKNIDTTNKQLSTPQPRLRKRTTSTDQSLYTYTQSQNLLNVSKFKQSQQNSPMTNGISLSRELNHKNNSIYNEQDTKVNFYHDNNHNKRQHKKNYDNYEGGGENGSDQMYELQNNNSNLNNQQQNGNHKQRQQQNKKIKWSKDIQDLQELEEPLTQQSQMQ